MINDDELCQCECCEKYANLESMATANEGELWICPSCYMDFIIERQTNLSFDLALTAVENSETFN